MLQKKSCSSWKFQVYRSDSECVETDRSLSVNTSCFLYLGPASLTAKTVENVSFDAEQ